jgi:uncharacterized protein with FMN-binding domain
MKDLYPQTAQTRSPVFAPGAGPVSGSAAALVLALLFSGCAGETFRSGGVAGLFRENFSSESGLSPENCRDGTWEGLGRGYRGNILVRLTVSGGIIRNIEVAEHGEDPAIGGEAMAELLDQVLSYGPAETEAISGATESSRGFLNAVEEALRQGTGAL